MTIVANELNPENFKSGIRSGILFLVYRRALYKIYIATKIYKNILQYATHLSILNTYFNKGNLSTNFKYITFLMFNIFTIVFNIPLNDVNSNLKFVDCGIVPVGNITPALWALAGWVMEFVDVTGVVD